MRELLDSVPEERRHLLPGTNDSNVNCINLHDRDLSTRVEPDPSIPRIALPSPRYDARPATPSIRSDVVDLVLEFLSVPDRAIWHTKVSGYNAFANGRVYPSETLIDAIKEALK